MSLGLPAFALLAAGLLRPDAGLAQDEPPARELEVESSPGTPVPARNAKSAAIVEAIRQAEKELADLETVNRAEAERRAEEIREAQDQISELRTQEKDLLAELKKLQDGLVELDGKVADAEFAKRGVEENAQALDREVATQAVDLKARFESSLLAAERPEVVESAQGIIDAQANASEDDPVDSGAQVEELVRLFEGILDDSRVVSTFRLPLRLAGPEGRVEQVDVLRLGLLSSASLYYHEPTGEAGFVITGGEGEEGFRGESRGLTVAQRAQIAKLVDAPARGGLVPTDVTGGAGIATLQGQVTLAQWFERGGVFMWVLLVIALVSLALVLERAIVLAILSLGVRLRIGKIVRLVDEGKLAEAERTCARTGGAVGHVIHAALVHRNKGRSVMEDSVQEALLHQAPRFQARLSFIALCAAIAPLVGLLGTVTGMILTFKMITLFGASDPRYMAGGISEALITTQGGLCVAIPSLVCRGILGAVAESALGRLEAGAMSVVLAILKARQERQPASPAGSAR